MKKIILTLCVAAMSLAAKAQWNFQFKFKTMSGTVVQTTPVKTFPGIGGFTNAGTIDLTPYICEGGQFRIENISNGTYNNCMSGVQTINSSTKWDIAYGEVIPGHSPLPPVFNVGPYLLNDLVWPAPDFVVTVPTNSAPYLSGTNTDPNFVYYQLAVAPKMGCNYFGVFNSSAGCQNLLFFYIKVKRAPKALPDLKVCPGTAITNALLGIPSGVTASNWSPSDPTVVPPTQTTIYSLNLSNGSCSLADQVKITLNNPSIDLFPNLTTTGCPDQLPITGTDVSSLAAKITVNGTVVYDANTAYTNSLFFNSYGNFQIFLPGTYTIVFEYYTDNTYSTICTKTYTVIVPPAPKLTVKNIALCSKAFTEICAPAGISGNVYTYKWYYTNTVLQQMVLVSHSQCFTPNAYGTYDVFMTNQYGCTYQNSYNVSQSPSLNPNADFSYTKGVTTNVVYNATPAALNTYNQWDLYLSNAAGAEVTLLQSINTSGMASAAFSARPLNQYYKIKHTVYSNPCNVTAVKAYLDYALPLPGRYSRNAAGSSEDAPDASLLNVYPNPGNGQFTISASEFGGGVMEVYDMTGKKVQSVTLAADAMDYSLDLSGYSKGVYLLNFIGTDKTQSKRIILE